MKTKLLLLLSIFLVVVLSKSCLCTSEGTWGVCVPATDDKALLNRIAELGPEYVRVDFVWPIVEPEFRTFNWGTFDTFVAFCKEHGIKIVAIVGYTPEWASGKQGINHMFKNTSDWLIYLWLLLVRYGKDIHAIEIWNEPNYPKFFSGTMEEYFEQILIPSSNLIRAINKDILIVAPSIAVLSGRKWTKWANEAVKYIDYFDVFSVHAYRGTDWSVIWKVEGIDEFERFREGVDQSIKQVIRGKFPKKPIWITETGFERKGTNGEGAQKDNIMGVIWGLPSIDIVFLYRLRDEKLNMDREREYDTYGLLKTNNERTKAFKYLRSFNPYWRDYAEDEEEGEEK